MVGLSEIIGFPFETDSSSSGALRRHSLAVNETNKLTSKFLETEAAFPYCNWSIKMARIIWFGSRSVDIGPAYVNNWKRLGKGAEPGLQLEDNEFFYKILLE